VTLVWPASVKEVVMFSQKVKTVMAHEACVLADPQVSVQAAARTMAAARTGALMVVVGGILHGVFTGRDALHRVTATGLDPDTTPIGQVMTTTLISVGPETSFGRALLMMHEHGLRQLPVLDDGRLLGVVHARDVLDPTMEEFVVEALRREAIGQEPVLHR
jgi:CBS domain-containing protein